MLFGDIREGNEFTNAGVGENNVDSLLHPSDRLVETIKIGQFGDVPLNARHVATDRRHGLVKLLLSTARDEDMCPLFDEEMCCSQPNPPGDASDDCNFSLQLAHSNFSSERCLQNQRLVSCFL